MVFSALSTGCVLWAISNFFVFLFSFGILSRCAIVICEADGTVSMFNKQYICTFRKLTIGEEDGKWCFNWFSQQWPDKYKPKYE